MTFLAPFVVVAILCSFILTDFDPHKYGTYSLKAW
jgi:hypothetical protein